MLLQLLISQSKRPNSSTAPAAGVDSDPNSTDALSANAKVASLSAQMGVGVMPGVGAAASQSSTMATLACARGGASGFGGLIQSVTKQIAEHPVAAIATCCAMGAAFNAPLIGLAIGLAAVCYSKYKHP